MRLYFICMCEYSFNALLNAVRMLYNRTLFVCLFACFRRSVFFLFFSLFPEEQMNKQK